MADKEYMTYNGFPLVKNGDTIYYGNFYDPFIVEMTIKATQTDGDTEVPTKVQVKMIKTDESLSPSQRVASPVTERRSMSDALNTAYSWLSTKVKPEE